MKKLFSFFFIFLLFSVAYSQENLLIVSSEDASDCYVSYFNGNNLFTYNSTFNTDFDSPSYNPKWKSEFSLIKYSSQDLSLIYKKNIVIPKENECEVLPHSLIPIEEKIILFSTHYYKKLKKIKLIARAIDENGILSSQTEVSEQENNSGDYCNFEINLSKDGKSIMIVSTPFYATNKDTKLVSSIIILDKELRFVWNENLGIKYPCYKPNSHNKPYYNANKFYFLGYTESELAKWDMNQYQVRNTFFCFDLSLKKLTSTNLTIEKMAEVDPYARMNYEIEKGRNNQVILIALPISSKTNNKIGAKPFYLKEYCFVFNSDLTELIYSNKYELTQELTGYSKFKVKNIFQDSEGGIYFITEYTTKNPPLPGSSKSKYDTGYLDIIVNYINPIKNESWTRKIKKDQGDYWQSYYSCLSFFNEDEIRIVLNDEKRENENNLKINSESYIFKDFSKEKNARTVFLSIDKVGNVEEDQCPEQFNNKSNLVSPNFAFYVSSKESVFLMKAEKGLKFGKLIIGKGK